MEKADKIKLKVQRIIVTISVILLVGKFFAYFITNSVGVLTDAMESIVNVIAGFISLYSLHLSAKPKDAEHPFGHGKVELISASAEGMMIFAAGGLIIYEGVKRLFMPAEIESLDTGIIVVALAGVVNYIMGWYSIRIGRKYTSMALIAGGKHLQSDTYSTIGLVIGLILLYVTKIAWIDSALALIFGGIIAWTGISILRKTVDNLMDKADIDMLEQVQESVTVNRQPDWIDIHNLKIIKYGSFLYIDCDLTVPWYYNIYQGHDTYDKLKNTISNEFAHRVQFSIHLDPCQEEHCPHCQLMECNYRKAPFVSPQRLTLKALTHSDE